MKTLSAHHLFVFSAAVITAALFLVRAISPEFAVGTTTYDHPYIIFVFLLIIAGLFWTSLLWLIPRLIDYGSARRILFGSLVLGVLLRVMFIGSTPIYENDWNRYLWDGAVLAEGINPYTYSPHDVLYTIDPEENDLQQLQLLSETNDEFSNTINYGDLTTIYPPVAQTVFGLGALINPFDLDVLRGFFILIDIASILLIIRILDMLGKHQLWALLYVLNPLLIYAGFNAVHMDIILIPFLLLPLLWINSNPFRAATALAFAGAVKLWPLILAPVLYRQWRGAPKIYIISAVIVTGIFLVLMSPLLMALKSNAGVVAYAGEWSRNAFFFPQLENLLGLILTEPGTYTRILVAALVAGLSLWIGFRKDETTVSLPFSLLMVSAALFLLSPTGYPWYAMWLIVFLPFAPSYGIAALTFTLPLYYTRYALAEQGTPELYTSILIPAQFLIPAAILIAEAYRYRRSHGT